MATAERKSEVLIDWDAIDLAFRIGQGVQKKIVRAAILRATLRKAQAANIGDVKAAAEEMGFESICRSLGENGDGKRRGATSAV